MAARISILGLCLGLLPASAGAEDRIVRLHAPPALTQTGLLSYILPRFSLKTQVRVEPVEDPAAADIVLGAEGPALFKGAGRVWHMSLAAPGDEVTVELLRGPSFAGAQVAPWSVDL